MELKKPSSHDLLIEQESKVNLNNLAINKAMMEEEDVKSEDDEVVQEKHVVEMEKGFSTIEKNVINSQPVFTPSEDTQDSIATSYEMHQARRPYRVPITKQFVFKKISGPTISTSSSSQKSSSSSSSARVTRGASTKRSNTDDIVDKSDDNVCYFTTQKKSKKGKKQEDFRKSNIFLIHNSMSHDIN